MRRSLSFLALTLAVAASAQWDSAETGYYVGSMENGHRFHLQTRRSGVDLDAMLAPAVGAPYWVFRGRVSPGYYTFVSPQGDHTSMILHDVDWDGVELVGTFVYGNEWRTPFKAHRVAFYDSTKWGDDHTWATLRSPRFVRQSPAHKTISGWLYSAAQRRARGFLTRDHGHAASHQERHVITYASPRLMSVRLLMSADAGGAHPSSTSQSRNFAIDGDRVQWLRLGELFEDRERGVAYCRGYVLEGLRYQGAPWVKDGRVKRIGDSQLDNWNVTPGGLVWHLDPYEVGPWSDGTYTVHLPFSELRRAGLMHGLVADLD